MSHPIVLNVCPLCWNTTPKSGDHWCIGNQWGMESPMEGGDHDAEKMEPLCFLGAREHGIGDYVAVDALFSDRAAMAAHRMLGTVGLGATRMALRAAVAAIESRTTEEGR